MQREVRKECETTKIDGESREQACSGDRFTMDIKRKGERQWHTTIMERKHILTRYRPGYEKDSSKIANET